MSKLGRRALRSAAFQLTLEAMGVDQIAIRPAELRDVAGLCCVHQEAWREAYRGIIPGFTLERMIERRGTARWKELICKGNPSGGEGLLVLEHGGRVAGYASLGFNRSPRLRVAGEVFELYLAPTYQGVGLGKRLFQSARACLQGAKRGHFVVWVLEDNERAVGFYRAMGGQFLERATERFAANPGQEPRRVAGKVLRSRLAFSWGGIRASQQ